MVRRFVQNLFDSNFIRHATILASGTLLANLITLLMLPLFARMFAPESFGLQSLLIMGTMVLGTLATGYYDWAVTTPKAQKQAQELATLALTLAILLALVSLVLLLVFGDELLRALDIAPLAKWAMALPLLALAFACYNIGNYWLLRAGSMGNLTQIRFVLPVTNAAVSLALGLMGYSTGLVIGFIAGVLLSGVWSLLLAFKHGLAFDLTHPRTHYQALASKFREFPIYGSIPATAMLLAGQIPLLVITRTYALGEAGHYAVVRALLYSGTMMVATATAQIILKHIAEARNRREAVWPHFTHMLWLVAGAGMLMGIALYSVSPFFFRYYLGASWDDSAAIARLMAFAMPFWLLGVSLASAPIALKHLKPIAAWQIGYGIAACYLFTLTDLPFLQLVERVIAFEIIAYAIYVAVSVVTLHRHGR